MTAYTWMAQYQQTTDAEFRAWGSAIKTALSTVGFVQTSDTGQIDWTTVLAPTVATTSQGYEIWRLNDAAQSTCPIYFKIEYGSGSTTPSARPNIWVTIGTGSNGSGTITGVTILSRSAWNTSTNGIVGDTPNWACYHEDTGSFWLSLAPNSGTAPTGFFGIFRWGEDDDTVGTRGVTTIHQVTTSSAIVTNHYRRAQASVLSGRGGWSYPFSQSAATLASGLTLPVFYNYGQDADGLRPMMGVFGHNSGDFQQGTIIPITAYGATRNFIRLPGSNSGSPSGTDQAQSGAAKNLFVYE
jgi:hypothetical protein